MTKLSTRFSRLVRAVRSLPFEDRVNVVQYGIGALWATLFFVLQPGPIVSVLHELSVVLWLGACVAGSGIAITGILHRRYLTIELAGVCIMLAGPLGYALVQIGLSVQEYVFWGTYDRVPLIVYAVWPAVGLLRRLYLLGSAVRAARKLPIIREERS